MTDNTWSPVVYARIPAHDNWWRTVPNGTSIPVSGWLATVVHAVVQGGRDLRFGPRFLLARRDGWCVVGVACQAAELSDSMHSDGARELYTFVGWHGTGPPPELTTLRKHFHTWAGVEYHRWMSPVWTHSAAESVSPQIVQSGPAPWPLPLTADPRSSECPPPEPAVVHVWPEAQADPLWRAAAMTDGLVTVIGLRVTRSTMQPGITHATSADTTDRRRIPTSHVDHSAAPTKTSPKTSRIARLVVDLVRRRSR